MSVFVTPVPFVYNAKIVRVIDGDTVEADVDLGFDVGTRRTFRLCAINAPEMRGDTRGAGVATKGRLADLILERDVVLMTFKDKTEKYGRYLATIFYEENGMWFNVNQKLVEEGLAVPYSEAKK